MKQFEYKELDFLQKRLDITRQTEKVFKQRCINPIKKEAILHQLVPYIPENWRKFWLNLQTDNDTSDLVMQEESNLEDIN
ncbi:unnamed protein product [Parnassius apollo]|uniref:(apollo) hypothetical protein n=1 Tax=Parnassius apollo TaxID=110799 RepID=A0A8S3XPP3_PARAO|nr:unnamed protein product [Parnassius apollo]